MDLAWQGYKLHFGLRLFPTQALAITQPTTCVRAVVQHCSLANGLVVHRKIAPPRKFCVHVRMKNANSGGLLSIPFDVLATNVLTHLGVACGTHGLRSDTAIPTQYTW